MAAGGRGCIEQETEGMKYCCEYFPTITCAFTWFSYDDDVGKKVYLMPCLIDNMGQRIRVNYCPVCGEGVRSIEIIEEEFNKINP